MQLGVKQKYGDVDWRQLASAIETADIERLEHILAHWSHVNSANAAGVTPLLRAACYPHINVVRALIDHGADVNAARMDGFTPLLLATFFGHTDTIKILLENGADITASTRSGTSAKMWALSRGFHDIAEHLEQWHNKSSQVLPANATDYEVRPFGLEELVENEADDPRPAIIDEPAAVAKELTIPEKREPLPPLVVRKLKEPLPIWDLVHENPNHFSASAALLSRLTSTRARVALPVVVVLTLIIGTVAVVSLRSEGKLTPTVDVAAPSEVEASAPRPVSAETKVDSVNTWETGEDATLRQPVVDAGTDTQRLQSPGDDQPLVLSSSQRLVRKPLRVTQPRASQVDHPIPTPNSVETDATAQSSKIVESRPSDKPTVSAVPATPNKPAPSANSQLITRPFGVSTAKPKTIQWP